MDLLTSGSRVEVPFLIVEVGSVKLGAFTRQQKRLLTSSHGELFDTTTYPNFIDGMTVVKNANGMVNKYTINLSYQITAQDDPNFIEKLFSTVSNDRRISVSYGDFMNPAHSFKSEECLISDIQRSIIPGSSRIDYTISAVSTTALASGRTWNFMARRARPSTVLREIIYNVEYGLLDILPGMRDYEKVNQRGLISANDIEVDLQSRQSVSVIDYIKYLVACMRDSTEFIQSSLYMIAFDGDVQGEMGGAYLKIVRVDEQQTPDEWTIDIGYPGTTDVFDFKVTEQNMYSILYDYESVQQSGSNTVIRDLDDKGNIVNLFRQPLAIDPIQKKTTDVAANWWSLMVNFPLTAEITIRGLIRPSILTSAININHWFYGQKYTTSGRYRIISDSVILNSNGFRERLGLLRVST
jgi:hypothetical protein